MQLFTVNSYYLPLMKKFTVNNYYLQFINITNIIENYQWLIKTFPVD